MFQEWENELTPNADDLEAVPGVKNLPNSKLWLLLSHFIPGFKASTVPLQDLRVHCQQVLRGHLKEKYPHTTFTDSVI